MERWEEEDGVELASGFCTLRVETNWMQCLVKEQLPLANEAALPWRHSLDRLEVLCSTVWLAPANYRHFEWAAAQRDALLTSKRRWS